MILHNLSNARIAKYVLESTLLANEQSEINAILLSVEVLKSFYCGAYRDF